MDRNPRQSSVRATLRAIGSGALCVICCALLVLLVPSSAWSDDTVPPPSSPSSSPLAGSSSASPVEPEPSPSATATEPPTPSEPVSETPESQAFASASLAESGCSVESPCVVVTDDETTAGLWLALGLIVLLQGAQLVSAWGRDS